MMVFTLFMSVKVAFSRPYFKKLSPTISWTITAVSTQSSLHNSSRHMQSEK